MCSLTKKYDVGTNPWLRRGCVWRKSLVSDSTQRPTMSSARANEQLENTCRSNMSSCPERWSSRGVLTDCELRNRACRVSVAIGPSPGMWNSSQKDTAPNVSTSDGTTIRKFGPAASWLEIRQARGRTRLASRVMVELELMLRKVLVYSNSDPKCFKHQRRDFRKLKNWSFKCWFC